MSKYTRFVKGLVFSLILFCSFIFATSNTPVFGVNEDDSLILDSNQDNECVEVGRYFEGYEIVDIVVYNDIAFLAIGYEGFLIVDVSNPENPLVLHHECYIGDTALLVLDGDFLYIGVEERYSGIESHILIYDISDPTNPVRKSLLFLDFYSLESIVFENNYIYLVGSGGFFLISVIDPIAPEIIFEKNYNFGSFLIVDDIILASEFGTMHVFNNSNQEDPELIREYIPKLNETQNLVLNEMTYVNSYILGTCLYGLAIFNATDLTNLTFCNLVEYPLDWGYENNQLIYKDDYLFYSWDENSTTSIFHINNITHPILSGIYNDSSRFVDVESSYLYFSNAGLDIIDISTIATPEVIGHLGDNGLVTSVVLADDHAFVADGFGGLDIYNIEDPENSELVSNYPGGLVTDVEIKGDFAYLLGKFEGLKILDISNKAQPVLVKEYPSFDVGEYNVSYFKDIFLLDDFAYLASPYLGLLILDISEPTNPVNISWYSTFYVDWVTAHNDMVFLSTNFLNSHLQILDVKDKANPTLLTRYNYTIYGSFHHVAVTNKYAFIITSAGILRTLKIKNIMNPENISAIKTYGSWGYFAHIAGRYVFTSASLLEVFDMKDPQNPLNVTTYFDKNYTDRFTMPGSTIYDIAVKDRYAYLAYGKHGFMIIRLPISATGRIGLDLTSSCVIIVSMFIVSIVIYRRKNEKTRNNK